MEETAGGTKHDNGKPPMDLLDSKWMEGTAKVLGFGAGKYDPHNWRQGIKVSRLVASAYRHLGAFNRGEDIDPESGLLHLEHLSCCVMFLHWMVQNRTDLDNRWRPSPVIDKSQFKVEGTRSGRFQSEKPNVAAKPVKELVFCPKTGALSVKNVKEYNPC